MKPAVLLIHGFTSHRASLESLIPELERRGIEWQYPILAGHGTSPRDLRDKRWPDWRQDVERAYTRLRQTHDQVIVIAISMGTLLGLELAATNPDRIAGLVLISPCIVFKNPLSKFAPIIIPFIRRFPFPPKDKFSSEEFWSRDRGYQWFPTSAYRSYWQRTRTILEDVQRVRCPVRLVQSRNDRIADPRGAQKIFDRLPGPKELLWHERSGHEMLLDCEAGDTLREVLGFAPLTDGKIT